MSKRVYYLGVALLVLLLVASAGLTQAQDLTTANAEREEVSFGDLTADALCDSADTTIGLVPAVSFNSGTVPANPTQEQVNGLLQNPKETWAVSGLTGVQIQRALERSLSRLPLPNTAFLQVSGLVVNFDVSRPRDQRITSVTAAGGALVPDRTYEVVMPLSMAQGGSGYFQIFGQDNIVRQGTQGLGEVIYQYRQANPNRVYTGQGRLVPAK
jgi:2',3'-cyclic-nucleotide 2'-phosphodiesterase (5'-nucleotidase family)